MKKYLAVIKIVWQQNILYKSNLFISFLIGNISLIGVYYFWSTLNSNLEEKFNNILTYVIIALILKQFIESFGLEWRITEDISEGKLTNLLQYPISYFNYLILILIGEKCLNLIIKLPILLLIFLMIYQELNFPTIWTFLLFTLSSIMAFFISSLITLCIGFTSFWFIEISGFFYLNNLISNLLSGSLIPLYLLSDYLQYGLKFLPYYYIIFFPVSIFIEVLDNIEIFSGLIIQIGWVYLLHSLCNFMYRKGVKQYENFGG